MGLNVLPLGELIASTRITLPSGREYGVPTYRLKVARWAGEQPQSFKSVPNKPALAFDDQPMWHEFIVLRLLERADWQGVWVKNWGSRRFWTDVSVDFLLPEQPLRLLESIKDSANVGNGGCWDVFAWRADRYLFVESKQRGKDALRVNQKVWLETGLRRPNVEFALAEYVVSD